MGFANQLSVISGWQILLVSLTISGSSCGFAGEIWNARVSIYHDRNPSSCIGVAELIAYANLALASQQYPDAVASGGTMPSQLDYRYQESRLLLAYQKHTPAAITGVQSTTPDDPQAAPHSTTSVPGRSRKVVFLLSGSREQRIDEEYWCMW